MRRPIITPNYHTSQVILLYIKDIPNRFLNMVFVRNQPNKNGLELAWKYFAYTSYNLHDNFMDFSQGIRFVTEKYKLIICFLGSWFEEQIFRRNFLISVIFLVSTSFVIAQSKSSHIFEKASKFKNDLFISQMLFYIGHKPARVAKSYPPCLFDSNYTHIESKLEIFILDIFISYVLIDRAWIAFFLLQSTNPHSITSLPVFKFLSKPQWQPKNANLHIP